VQIRLVRCQVEVSAGLHQHYRPLNHASGRLINTKKPKYSTKYPLSTSQMTWRERSSGSSVGNQDHRRLSSSHLSCLKSQKRPRPTFREQPRRAAWLTPTLSSSADLLATFYHVGITLCCLNVLLVSKKRQRFLWVFFSIFFLQHTSQNV